MKHHLRFKKVIAFVLALTMSVTVLASCEDKDDSSSQASESTVSTADDSSEAPDSIADSTDDSTGDQGGEQEPEAKVLASAVKFLSSGKYTTVVEANSADVDLSGLTADNVEVTYIGLDPSTVIASSAEEAEAEDGEEGTDETSSEAVTEAEAETEAEEFDFSAYEDGERKATLDSLTKKDDGSWEISFTDENAVKYGTSQYSIRMKDVKEIASVEVEFPELTLTPDITTVSAAATEVKLTLTLNDSEFADEVTNEMISLYNGFENMTVDSVSASGKNLTMLLKGDISTYNSNYGANLVGTVGLDPEAVKDCGFSLRANVGIESNYAGFVGSTLKFEDGKITADFEASGTVNVDELTKDNLKIEGVTVESVEKKDDNSAAVVMTAKDIKSVNDFVDLVSGKDADFAGCETKVTLSQASFYPVFDYCEADGDNLKMTLVMYCYGGTFSSELKAEDITLGNEFEGGKTESIEVAEDGATAKVIVSVPANGQKEDDFSYYGEVKLAAGAMTSAWGEKTSKEASFDRVYSQDTIGKAILSELFNKIDTWLTYDSTGFYTDVEADKITLNKATLKAIQEWTRGKDVWYGGIIYWGTSFASAASFGKWVLEITGIMKSDQEKLMDELHKIQEAIAKIDKKLEAQRKQLINLEKEIYRNGLEQYERTYQTFISSMEAVEYAYQKAGEDLEEQGITISDTATEKQYQAYNKQLINYIYKRGAENGGANSTYGSFDKNFEKMREAFNDITGYYMGGTGLNCPLDKYDKLYALMYNFDTQSYADRFLQRVTLRAKLTEAIPLLAFRYQIPAGTYDSIDPKSDFGKCVANYTNALAVLERYEVTGIAPEDAVFGKDIKEVDQKISQKYIKEICLWGDDTFNPVTNLDALGYTVIPYDLNKKAGGFDIYLGYKTTNDYNEAIKDITFRTGKGKNGEPYEKDKRKYNLPILRGDTEFTVQGFTDAGTKKRKAQKGDLNRAAGGEYIYMYYTKEEGEDKTAITELYINNLRPGSIDGVDLNKGAGGDDIFLHATRQPKGGYYITDLKLEAKKLDDKAVSDYNAEKSGSMNDYKVLAQNLNQGNPNAGGYHIYLGYTEAPSYEDGIKDIRICKGTKGQETIVYDNRQYHLCAVSDSDSGFAASLGDLNYNGSSEITDNSLYIYYTKDKLADDMGVTTITFDNEGYGAVCNMNLNSGAGGDVIYMHTDRQNDKNYRRTVKACGSDPNYHPYCYVLGGTVNYVTVFDMEPNVLNTYNKKSLGSSAGRDWTNEEISDFFERSNKRKMKDEFALAGIDFKSGMLYMKNSKAKFESGGDASAEIQGSGVQRDSTGVLNEGWFWTFLGKKDGKCYWYDHTEPAGFLTLD